ncbi:MAG: hypothetical protein ACFFD2_26095, partial [Promethearchaeota archaeon]
MNKKKLNIIAWFQLLTLFLSLSLIPLLQIGKVNFISNNFNEFLISTNGTPDILWTANGTAICTETSSLTEIQICSDSEGGAIIVWTDIRNDSDGDIYAQKVNSTGHTQWTIDGVAIHASTETERRPQLCSDGEGGAIITWEHNGISSSYDIYAQRINSTGDFPWGGVKEVYGGALAQQYPQICSDEQGGAI